MLVVEWFNRMLKNDDVENIYTQRQLQMDRQAAASRIRLQRAKASHYQHATRRHNSRDRWKTLNMMYSVIKIADKIQSGRLRVSKYKTIFEKSYTPNWTTEMFKIVKVQPIP